MKINLPLLEPGDIIFVGDSWFSFLVDEVNGDLIITKCGKILHKNGIRLIRKSYGIDIIMKG